MYIYLLVRRPHILLVLNTIIIVFITINDQTLTAAYGLECFTSVFWRTIQ